MTWTFDTAPRGNLWAKPAVGLAICALLAVTTFATPVDARSRAQENLPPLYSGYYAAPPVAYGWPYGYGYYAPPYAAYYAPPYGYYGGPYYPAWGVYDPRIGWRDPNAGGP
jgi:hypothetical protein